MSSFVKFSKASMGVCSCMQMEIFAFQEFFSKPQCGILTNTVVFQRRRKPNKASNLRKHIKHKQTIQTIRNQAKETIPREHKPPLTPPKSNSQTPCLCFSGFPGSQSSMGPVNPRRSPVGVDLGVQLPKADQLCHLQKQTGRQGSF